MMWMQASIAGAVIALAGCTGGLGLPPMAGAKGAPSMALLGGDFTVVGPSGYCIDPHGSRPKSGFAIMAPCSVLGAQGSAPRVHAVATVQVGAVGSAIVAQDPSAFAAYLGGPDGPQVLSRVQDADSVTIYEVRRSGDYVVVYLRDDSPAAIDGLQEAEWRAFVDVGDRLVTLALRGLDGAPLSDAAGAALLGQSVKAVVSANTPQDPVDA